MPAPASGLFVVHADWGKKPGKRRLASATIEADGRIRAEASEPVRDASRLLERRPLAAPGIDRAFFGFDFPIGLPAAYAARAKITSFHAFLIALADGAWPDFARVAERPEEISVERPFYPYSATGIGSQRVRQHHLLDAHGVDHMDALRRRCERGRPGRRAACALFWTLGSQQAGRGALAGWQEVLLPALGRADLDVALWPFDGPLDELLDRRSVTVAETYPAELYAHLGIEMRGSKRRQRDRQHHADTLRVWARRHDVELSDALDEEIGDGFGSKADGEDRFDAVVGLFGMLGIVLGRRPSGEPSHDPDLPVEGWILGRDHRA